MFERYTERARRVVFFARYEVSRLGGSAIDTEHLLLGLLREGKGAASDILRRNEITYQAVLKQVEARVPIGERHSTSVDVPLTAEARRALQDAADESERLHAPHIGSEHLLLGLLGQPDCLAADILSAKGLRLDHVREEIRLQSSGKHALPRPATAFPKLADLLHRLEQLGTAYHVSSFRPDAIRVDVGLAEERWVATFFPDGQVAVEVLSASGVVEDESALTRLLDRLEPPNKSDG